MSVAGPPCGMESGDIESGESRSLRRRLRGEAGSIGGPVPRPAPRTVAADTPDAVAITHFPLKLVSRRMLAPTVAHLTFVRDDGQPLDFIPGQFVQVHFHYADGMRVRGCLRGSRGVRCVACARIAPRSSPRCTA